MSFSELGLSAELLRAVEKQGYEQATPIQLQAIPVILNGEDLLAGAQTGTGKTAGFTLPLLQLLQQSAIKGQPHRVRALILVPTRELANQVAESVRSYGQYLPFRTGVIYGGVGIHPQIQKLRAGVDIVVATPGRLIDHINRRTIDLRNVETLVLDEADRMLDMGFIHDIRKVLRVLPAKRQNLLFSATVSAEISKLAGTLLKAPREIQVARRNTTAEGVSQLVHPVDQSKQRALLAYLIGSNNWRQVLVFARTKRGADRLCQQLLKDGLSSIAIHGNKSQGARTRALDDFKKGKVRVLVATDIAARGLDIDQLPHVVNHDLPNVAEDYIHRIGRTARAGLEGHAVSLVCAEESEQLIAIERLLKKSIPQEAVAGFEPEKRLSAAPSSRSRNPNPSRNSRPSGRRRGNAQNANGAKSRRWNSRRAA
jgi:ATP-dependent RNA helicase RhlE